MTDVSVGPLSAEEARIRDAADQAYRILQSDDDPARDATARLLDLLRASTRQSPLQALAIAFILGIFIARRR